MKLWKRGLRAAGVWLINKSGEPHVTSFGTFVVPDGVTRIKVHRWKGGGGGGNTVFSVTPGQSIDVRLPGGGGSGIREW